METRKKIVVKYSRFSTFVINTENKKSKKEIEQMIKQKNLPKKYGYYLPIHSRLNIIYTIILRRSII